MTPDSWPLKPFIPANTHEYCFDLQRKYGFDLKITKPRKSKLGDYRFRVKQKTHQITINRDLNQFAFLIVYLHEVAHCITTINHGLKLKPHGKHWQSCMRGLLAPLLKNGVFPVDIEQALLSYLKAPRASSCSHPDLTRALRKYDLRSNLVPLEELSDGSEFYFRSRRYRRIKLRRTRISCLDFTLERVYLIPKLALVRPANQHFPGNTPF